MQTILVTGAGGFVGTYLVPLLAPNYKVIATGRRLPVYTPSYPNISTELLDFSDEGSVAAVVKKHKPDVIVHAGALSKPDECEVNNELAFSINVQGTKHLLNAAKDRKSFFIFLSTDFVFDGEMGFYKEEDPTGTPVNYYGATKLLAEEAVKDYPFSWSIIRTVLVYGKPGEGRQNILTVVADKLKNGEGYNVFNDQVRTPTYVEDLAGAITKIIELKKEGLFHISGKDVLTPFQMAERTAEYLQLDKSLLKAVDRASFIQRALRPLKTGFDISKAKRELGYEPISFDEGLKKTFSP
jgi:dTDP-4-dehydrorhamnose reductase